MLTGAGALRHIHYSYLDCVHINCFIASKVISNLKEILYSYYHLSLFVIWDSNFAKFQNEQPEFGGRFGLHGDVYGILLVQ